MPPAEAGLLRALGRWDLLTLVINGIKVPVARFVLPGGLVIPAMALALIAWLLASSSFAETRDVAVLIAFGALLHGIGQRYRRKTR